MLFKLSRRKRPRLLKKLKKQRLEVFFFFLLLVLANNPLFVAIRELAKAMAEAEANGKEEEENNDADPDLYGQGDDDLDGRRTSGSTAPLDKGEDADLYDQDPDAVVFNESFGGRFFILFLIYSINLSYLDGGLGSDNEPRGEDGNGNGTDDDEDDNMAAGMGHADDEMDVDDVPTNNASIILFFISFAY